MAEERGVLRRIVWRDVFPGIMLFRCFRMSIGLSVLFLATVGTLLMPLGPWLVHRDSLGQISPLDLYAELPGTASDTFQGPRWTNPSDSVIPVSIPVPRSSVKDSYLVLIRPFVQLFDRQASMRELFDHLGVALWYLLVWSLVGGAITRIAIVRLGCGEQVTLRQALRHTLVNSGWYFSSPLFPLLGAAFTAIPLFILGLLMHANFGVLVAGIFWPLALLGGLTMTALLVGLLFGWPLMWPTISAEEASDSFQAFSNSFSFTYQRPLSYLAYALLAVVLGGLGGILVEGFAEAILTLTHWAISFGLGRDRLNQLLAGQLDTSSTVWVGSGLIDLGNRLVRTVATAYYFSFLFCAASAIYLLLRREVDQTDFDEVYLPEGVEQFSLPPLRQGPHGVPEIDEPRTSTTTDGPSE